ncbi:MAG TPA: hypothetical protein VFZ40_16390 [Pyrinomonadaceae bacterium]
MSTDFIALFDVSLEEINADWLVAKLSADPSFGAEVVDHFRDLWETKRWTLDSSPTTRQSRLLGPGGFAVDVRPQMIELYHMIPFRIFVSDVALRKALRNACLSIADLVGSTRAIYTHELMPYKGQGLIEIERNLRTKIGLPATTFEELHEAEYYGPRAWYVDTFEDLRLKDEPRLTL